MGIFGSVLCLNCLLPGQLGMVLSTPVILFWIIILSVLISLLLIILLFLLSDPLTLLAPLLAPISVLFARVLIKPRDLLWSLLVPLGANLGAVVDWLRQGD